MSILVGKDTKLIIQGMTGKGGRVHARRIIDYGGNLIAGVTPGKGGTEVEGRPVYNTVAEAKAAHPEINASLILTPSSSVRSAGFEAVEAGIDTIVISTEWVPVRDTLDIVTAARKKGLTVIGPNTVGVISPGKGILGIMPGNIYGKGGHIGLVSRSGTLTHENSSNLTFAGYGISTSLGIGGDPIIGLNHKEALVLFRDDEETKLIVMIGERRGGACGKVHSRDEVSEADNRVHRRLQGAGGQEHGTCGSDSIRPRRDGGVQGRRALGGGRAHSEHPGPDT